MNDKVIFLDIDGVLNSDTYLDGVDHSNEIHWKEFWINNIDCKSVVILNEIIEKTGSSVVVSSTWRIMMDFIDIKSVLEIVGFQGTILGCTPYIKGNSRGEEIKAWLKENPTKQFVIIDDVVDFDEELTSRLIKTNCSFGLIQSDIGKAVRLFNVQKSELSYVC
jgi:hypothetical protein